MKTTPTANPAYAGATMALVNGLIIDGTGAEPIPAGVILLKDERILAIGTASTLAVPEGVKAIDLQGAAVLPGFINAHVHFGFSRPNLKAWAQGGVTTVRDESTSASQVATLKNFQNEIEADASYARLVSAGSMLGVPGGYGFLDVVSMEDAHQAVLTEVSEGVNAVKVCLEDGYAGAHDLPKLSPEELKIIVETAHENGLPVSGHVTQAAYIQPLLDAGVDDIAHIPWDRVPPEVLQEMVDRGIYFTPTFSVYHNYGAPVSQVQDNLRRFVELGGQVALGNDYGGGPGDFELGIPMYEIAMMEGAGMTPMQVLQASTLTAARVLRLEAEIGSLEAGKIADIAVFGGNPLDDLQNLSHVKMVIHNGVVIRNEFGE